MPFKYKAEQFEDTKILRYQIPDFNKLTIKQKKLLYYLQEASLSGRDIYYDQNYKFYTFSLMYIFPLKQKMFRICECNAPVTGCHAAPAEWQSGGLDGSATFFQYNVQQCLKHLELFFQDHQDHEKG